MTGIISENKARTKIHDVPPRRFHLDWHEEWPLFSVQKHLLRRSDGTELVLAEVDDIPDLSGKMDAWPLLIQELYRLERWCWHDGIAGWMASVKRTNTRMERSVVAVGAKAYRQDQDYRYFVKYLPTEPPRLLYRDVAKRLSTIKETPWLTWSRA